MSRFSTFRERLDQALNAAEQSEGNRPRGGWALRKLEDLAEVISARYGHSVIAAVRTGPFPRVRQLELSPFSRPDEVRTLLAVHASQSQAIVLGQQQQLFWREGEFGEYLVHLVKQPEFMRLLRSLQSRNSEPAHGILRAGKPRQRNLEQDVCVEIPHDVQTQIGRAYREGRDAAIDAFEVKTSLGPPIACGAIDEMAPQWLLAAGIVLELDPQMLRVDQGTKTVQLQGRVRPNL